jgi:hypothetical protein
MALVLKAKDHWRKFVYTAQTTAGLVANPTSRAFVHGIWLQASMKRRVRA